MNKNEHKRGQKRKISGPYVTYILVDGERNKYHAKLLYIR